MRFLIINYLYCRGGAEEMARLEQLELSSMGDQVRLLTFDPNFPFRKSPEWVNCPYNPKGLSGVLQGRLVVRKALANLIYQELADFKPDVVHAHNVRNLLPSLVKATQFFRQQANSPTTVSIYTAHDFSIICPRVTCVNSQGLECRGVGCSSCKECGGSFFLAIKRRVVLRQIALIRKEFNIVLCPSASLKERCLLAGLPAMTVRNPCAHIEHRHETAAKSRDIFLFSGAISSDKGALELLEAWEEFIKRASRPVKLLFAGSVQESIRNQFENKVATMDSVEYIGRIEHEDLLNLMSRAWVTVIPSIWMENYPTVALESIASGTIAIGSRRGGIPEIICTNELLFDAGDVESCVKTLLYVHELSEKRYRQYLLALQSGVKETIEAKAFAWQIKNISMGLAKERQA